MKPETLAFLELVRDAEEPSVEDQRRVSRALGSAIAAGAMPSVALGSSVLPSALGSAELGRAWVVAGWLGKALGGTLAKLSVLGVGAALSFGRADSTSLALYATRSPGDGALLRAPALPTESAQRPLARQTVLAAPTSSERVQSRAPLATRMKSMPPQKPEHGGPAAPPSKSEPVLRAELELLKQVQADLRQGAGARALARLDAHQTSDRQFAAERAAARVLALCAAGKPSEAGRAASSFARKHPDSVQRAAVLDSCAYPKRTRAP